MTWKMSITGQIVQFSPVWYQNITQKINSFKKLNPTTGKLPKYDHESFHLKNHSISQPARYQEK